jgi:hypothetical protein
MVDVARRLALAVNLLSLAIARSRDGSEVRVETSKVYRQQAAECLQFANEASDAYVKVALTELSIEFLRKAEAVEQPADKPTDENLAGSRGSV